MVSLFIILFTWQKALIYPVSSKIAGESRYLYESGNFEESLTKINSAIKISPDVVYYYYFKHIILRIFANNTDVLSHPECTQFSGQTNDNEEYKKCIAEDLYSSLLTAKLQNPYWYFATVELAEVSKQLGLDQESLNFYQESVRLLPTNRVLLHLLAQEYLARGMHDETIEIIDKSLRITQAIQPPENNTRFTDEALDIKNRAISMQSALEKQNAY
jgi:tetratricopeptide (TPR) repeat protein